jgi:hypothetical protein
MIRAGALMPALAQQVSASRSLYAVYPTLPAATVSRLIEFMAQRLGERLDLIP